MWPGRSAREIGRIGLSNLPRLCCVALTLLALVALNGCGTNQSDGPDIDCGAGELYDPANDRCIPGRGGGSGTDGGMGGDVSADDASIDRDTDADDLRDTGLADTGTPDTGQPGPEDTGIDPMCDKDNDRALAKSCGGNDCDDNDPKRSPNVAERCDTIDNNCSGKVNDGLDCSFYAHEGETLYRVNPFDKSAKKVGERLPGLHDLDTHPDGTLFGITPQGFYKFDDQTGKWDVLRKFPDNASWVPKSPNGLAIDRFGKVYITSEDTIWTITYKPEESGDKRWWLEKLGTAGTTKSGAKLVSSGDCVINKRTLYMTSKHDDSEDHLVELPTGQKNPDPMPLALGHKNVFGLTTAWGTLYGLTQDGKLIEIDPRTGKTSLVHTFQEREWYGAASTPRRQ